MAPRNAVVGGGDACERCHWGLRWSPLWGHCFAGYARIVPVKLSSTTRAHLSPHLSAASSSAASAMWSSVRASPNRCGTNASY
eukprot:4324821-Pyramimonas_sp.AAC.1